MKIKIIFLLYFFLLFKIFKVFKNKMVLIFIMKSSHPLLMFRFITNRYFCYILLVRFKKKKNFGNKPFPSYSKMQMMGDLYIFCYFFFCVEMQTLQILRKNFLSIYLFKRHCKLLIDVFKIESDLEQDPLPLWNPLSLSEQQKAGFNNLLDSCQL